MYDSVTALKLEQYGVAGRRVGITKYGEGDYAFNYSAPAGVWTHLVFVGTGSETRLYANGQLQGSIPVSMTLPLGQISGTVRDRFKGLLNEVQLFDRALTDSEILSIYNSGNAGLSLPGGS